MTTGLPYMAFGLISMRFVDMTNRSPAHLLATLPAHALCGPEFRYGHDKSPGTLAAGTQRLVHDMLDDPAHRTSTSEFYC